MGQADYEIVNQKYGGLTDMSWSSENIDFSFKKTPLGKAGTHNFFWKIEYNLT